MKKTIILILFSVIYFSNTVKAQFIQGFGLTGGLTYCNQKLKIDSTGDAFKYKYRFGGNASIFVEYINLLTLVGRGLDNNSKFLCSFKRIFCNLIRHYLLLRTTAPSVTTATNPANNQPAPEDFFSPSPSAFGL